MLKSALERGELSSKELTQVVKRLTQGKTQARPETVSRRADILQAATEVFVTEGYHAATLEKIAGKLGLTRPAFYYYFKSKQKILEAICRESMDEADKVIEMQISTSAKTPAERFRNTLVVYARHIARADTTAIMMRNFDEMSPLERKRLTVRRRARQDGVENLLRQAIAAGELKSSEPTIATLTIFEAIHSIHNWIDKDGRLSPEEISELVVDQLMDGLTSTKQTSTVKGSKQPS